MSEKYRYDQRGVSATKDEVHQAIKHLDKGIFPNAFCKILPDIAAGDPEYCNIMHADTAGIAQDALVMNLDDMACVGSVAPILFLLLLAGTSSISRAKS